MEQTYGEPAVDWRRHLAVLRTRKWSVLTTAALVAGPVLLLSAQQTPVYQASAYVLVQPLPSAPSGSTSVQPVEVSTEAQIVASEPVAATASRDLEKGSPTSILGGLSVQGSDTAGTLGAANSSQVLVITYTSPDPEFARDAANSFASSYIKYRGKQALNRVTSAQKVIRTTIRKISARLARVDREETNARQSGNQSLLNSLDTERNVLLSRLGVSQQRLDEVQSNASAEAGGATILNSAQLPTSPSSPAYLVNGLFVLGLGLGLGVTAAFVRERLDDRFKSQDDVERVISAPVLASVPDCGFEKGKGLRQRVVTISEPGSTASEAFRGMRTCLPYVARGETIRTMLITSASAGEGKTLTAANLGVVLAQSGRRVVLISSDLRRPALEGYFGVEENNGLATWLLGAETDLGRITKESGIANLALIPAGPTPGNPGELLTSPRLEALIKLLMADYDALVFDSPPTLPLTDARIIAPLLDGVLLVVDASNTKRPAVIRAKLEVERAGGKVLGCVMNFADPSSSPYGSHESILRHASDDFAVPAVSSNGRGPRWGRNAECTPTS